jgi:hypothetical protein
MFPEGKKSFVLSEGPKKLEFELSDLGTINIYDITSGKREDFATVTPDGFHPSDKYQNIDSIGTMNKDEVEIGD